MFSHIAAVPLFHTEERPGTCVGVRGCVPVQISLWGPFWAETLEIENIVHCTFKGVWRIGLGEWIMPMSILTKIDVQCVC